MVTSRTLGIITLTITLVCYSYYTIWILVMPMVDEDHPLQDYFPDRMIGIMFTTLLGYGQIAFMLTAAGIVLVRDS
jgi:dolichol phosphate-mannose biosynthesis regulatory protein